MSTVTGVDVPAAVVDEDDLEDMTQECLAKVWLKGGTFRGQSKNVIVALSRGSKRIPPLGKEA